MLGIMGFSVIAVGDGQEGIEVFRRRSANINLIICDLNLPKMDGRKIVAVLHEMSPGIPAIFTSGHYETAGFAHELPGVFLSKPYGRDDLRLAIDNALQDVSG